MFDDIEIERGLASSKVKKIFEWDNPPITNEKGDRNNPHEDWQCRCEAIFVID